MPYGEVLYPDADTVEPQDLRNRLFDKLIEVAEATAADPRDFTPKERCLRTVYGVLNAIDGGAGNRADGEGLPLLQLIPSPHPDFTAAHARKHGEVFDNGVPFDYGLLSDEFTTGVARSFTERYEETRHQIAKSAKDLFD